MLRYIPNGNGQSPWSFRSIPVCPGCVHPGAWKWNPRKLVGVQSIPVRSGGCVRVVGFLACLSGSFNPALGVVWFLNSARKHTQTMAEKMDPDNPQDAREWTFSCVKNISVLSVHRSCARQWKCKCIERHSNEPGCKMERMYPTTPRAHVNHWPPVRRNSKWRKRKAIERYPGRTIAPEETLPAHGNDVHGMDTSHPIV